MTTGKRIDSLAGCTIKGQNNHKFVGIYHPSAGLICQLQFKKDAVGMGFVKSVKAALQAMTQMETEQEGVK